MKTTNYCNRNLITFILQTSNTLQLYRDVSVNILIALYIRNEVMFSFKETCSKSGKYNLEFEMTVGLSISRSDVGGSNVSNDFGRTVIFFPEN